MDTWSVKTSTNVPAAIQGIDAGNKIAGGQSALPPATPTDRLT
jgi:hypothetical protein